MEEALPHEVESVLMTKYYLLSVQMTKSKRPGTWLLSDWPRTPSGTRVDRGLFSSGTRYDGRYEQIVFDLTTQGLPVPFNLARISNAVVQPDVAQELEAAIPGNFERIPVTILDGDGGALHSFNCLISLISWIASTSRGPS